MIDSKWQGKCEMSRFFVPRCLLAVMLPIIISNMICQVLYLIGFLDGYDGWRFGFVFSIGYLVAIGVEIYEWARGRP